MCRAIRDVLELRQSYLRSQGISDLRYVLTNKQRVEPIECARADFEDSQEQRDLQKADVQIWRAKRKEWGSNGAIRRGRRTGRSARQLAHETLPVFLETEKQKRWCQHLHQVCCPKQV